MSYTGIPVGAYPQPMQPWGDQLDQNGIAMGPQPYQDFSGQYYYTRPQGTTQSTSQPLYQRRLHGTNNSTGTTQNQTAHQGQFGSAILSQGQPSPMNSTVNGRGAAHSHYASPGPSQAPWASQSPANARAASQQWAMPPPTNAQVVSGQWAMSPSTNLQAAPPQQTIHQGGFQQPGLPQATLHQTAVPLAALPQTGFPPAPIPQGNISWPTNPQAVVPQPTGYQAGFLQPGLPQATPQQTGPPQTAFPQADFRQEASTEATVPQAIPPHNISQQPYYPVEASQHPQEPSLSFDERLAAFRPVPEPHPEPVARPGPGRKKKLQRFWAPEGASEDLKKRYGRLQTVDQRVTIAERKLDKNKDKPSFVPHLQNILIRNMQEREDLWTQCQRVESGLIAIELPLPEAEALAVKMHKAWKDERVRYDAKVASLKADNQQAIDDNGGLDNQRLDIKDRQGLQTMSNWSENRWSLLCDSLDTLTYAFHAFHLIYEATMETDKAFLMHLHKLGIYEGWSRQRYGGDSQHMIEQRRRFSDPDPTTWGLEYEDQPPPVQEQPNNEAIGSSSDPGHADAPHEIDPDYPEEQQPEQPQGQEDASIDGQIQGQVHGGEDFDMEDASSFVSDLVILDEDDELERTGDDEWLEGLWGAEME